MVIDCDACRWLGACSGLCLPGNNRFEARRPIPMGVIMWPHPCCHYYVPAWLADRFAEGLQ
jgi:hypothetical protein